MLAGVQSVAARPVPSRRVNGASRRRPCTMSVASPDWREKAKPIAPGSSYPAKEHCSSCGLCDTYYIAHVKARGVEQRGRFERPCLLRRGLSWTEAKRRDGGEREREPRPLRWRSTAQDACAFLGDGMSRIEKLEERVHGRRRNNDVEDEMHFGAPRAHFPTTNRRPRPGPAPGARRRSHHRLPRLSRRPSAPRVPPAGVFDEVMYAKMKPGLEGAQWTVQGAPCVRRPLTPQPRLCARSRRKRGWRAWGGGGCSLGGGPPDPAISNALPSSARAVRRLPPPQGIVTSIALEMLRSGKVEGVVCVAVRPSWPRALSRPTRPDASPPAPLLRLKTPVARTTRRLQGQDDNPLAPKPILATTPEQILSSRGVKPSLSPNLNVLAEVL